MNKNSLATSLGMMIIFSLFLSSCKPNKVENQVSEPKAMEVAGPAIPGVTGDVMTKLLNNCTSIDYIFKNMNFSLNMSEKDAILQNIGFIDINAPMQNIPAECKPIGRKFFKLPNAEEYAVDVYLTTNCRFYVFVDKANKPIFANKMTEQGIQYYINTAQQARQTVR